MPKVFAWPKWPSRTAGTLRFPQKKSQWGVNLQPVAAELFPSVWFGFHAARVVLLVPCAEKEWCLFQHEILTNEMKKLHNFICTRTKPRVFWKPKAMNSAAESRLKESKKTVDSEFVCYSLPMYLFTAAYWVGFLFFVCLFVLE